MTTKEISQLGIGQQIEFFNGSTAQVLNIDKSKKQIRFQYVYVAPYDTTTDEFYTVSVVPSLPDVTGGTKSKNPTIMESPSSLSMPIVQCGWEELVNASVL